MSEILDFSQKANYQLSDFEFVQSLHGKGSKLGIGSFAEVKLAREKKTQQVFALKIVNFSILCSFLIFFLD